MTEYAYGGLPTHCLPNLIELKNVTVIKVRQLKVVCKVNKYNGTHSYLLIEFLVRYNVGGVFYFT